MPCAGDCQRCRAFARRHRLSIFASAKPSVPFSSHRKNYSCQFISKCHQREAKSHACRRDSAPSCIAYRSAIYRKPSVKLGARTRALASIGGSVVAARTALLCRRWAESLSCQRELLKPYFLSSPRAFERAANSWRKLPKHHESMVTR